MNKVFSQPINSYDFMEDHNCKHC